MVLAKLALSLGQAEKVSGWLPASRPVSLLICLWTPRGIINSVFFHPHLFTFLKTPLLSWFVWPILCYNYNISHWPFSSWNVPAPRNLQVSSWIWWGFCRRRGGRIGIFREDLKPCWHRSLHHSAHGIFETCTRTQIPILEHTCVFLDRNLLSDLEQASVLPSCSQSRAGCLPDRPPAPHQAWCSIAVNKAYSDSDIKLQLSGSSSLCYLESFSEFSSGLIFQNLILLFWSRKPLPYLCAARLI